MKLYKNYHVTGGCHMVEFVQGKPGEWHYRLRWAPLEFFQIKAMKGVFDGDGVFWGEFNGHRLFRLDEVDKTTLWEGAKYPEMEIKTVAPPPPPPPAPSVETTKPNHLSLEDLTSVDKADAPH